MESRGLPAVFVASGAFVEAAETQSKALGFNPASVFVDHPIQDRTDQEMRDMAGRAADKIIAAIFAKEDTA